MGFIYFIIFCDYALNFYFGSILIEESYENVLYDRNYTAGDVLVIFFSIMIGSFSLGQAGPCFASFAKGQVSGAKVIKLLNRVPLISLNE